MAPFAAVLDTNVLVSGIANTRGVPRRLLKIWQTGSYNLVVSETILMEVEHTLAKTYFQQRLTAGQIRQAIMYLRRWATVTPIVVQVQGVATHRQVSGEQGPVILPILLEHAEVPPLLRNVQWLGMTDRNVDKAVERLLEAIRYHARSRMRDGGKGNSVT